MDAGGNTACDFVQGEITSNKPIVLRECRRGVERSINFGQSKLVKKKYIYKKEIIYPQALNVMVVIIFIFRPSKNDCHFDNVDIKPSYVHDIIFGYLFRT